MARIWQEGFEDGFPNTNYLENYYVTPQIKDYYINFPDRASIVSGRNAFSLQALLVGGGALRGLKKYLNTNLTEFYFRSYIYLTSTSTSSTAHLIQCISSDGANLIGILTNSIADSYQVKVLINGTYTQVATLQLSTYTWYKVEIYFKANGSTGAYEVKIDDVSIISNSGLNTGTAGINAIAISNESNSCTTTIDDIALNDTTGSINNSWCGSGTIVSLKPKNVGNYSQWDTCEGYAKAESGTGTTTIKITGHGLATNDVIYNKTREQYRIVTVTDANTLTVSSITSQAENDIILMYNVQATISAVATTSTSQVTIPGHNLTASDVIVNTTRSNAIRKVIYTSGNIIYNAFTSTQSGVIGATTTSQAAGDSIKTFKFKPYTITNHWEAVSNQIDASPKLSYIRSTTLNDIDTFDMEELVSDKGLPSGSTVVAVSHNIYAQEAGAGSEIKPVFRISGTDYAGDTQTLSSGTLQYQKIYETSPATSSAWSRSEIDGLEAGVKLV